MTPRTMRPVPDPKRPSRGVLVMDSHLSHGGNLPQEETEASNDEPKAHQSQPGPHPGKDSAFGRKTDSWVFGRSLVLRPVFHHRRSPVGFAHPAPRHRLGGRSVPRQDAIRQEGCGYCPLRLPPGTVSCLGVMIITIQGRKS